MLKQEQQKSQDQAPRAETAETLTQALFVGADLQFKTGEAAAQALAETNDHDYIMPNKGVVRVPRDRWQIAQAYERRTWMEQGAHALDDRNDEHARHFDGYGSLIGKKFARAIELGCGPFTNLRIIANHCRIDRAVLVDPLIDQYQEHRNCRYRHGMVMSKDTQIGAQLKRTSLGRGLRRILLRRFPATVIQGVKVERFVSSSIEDLPAIGNFDLIVMINVLEHCYDAELIFAKILSLATPGTIFVFADKLYKHERVEANVRRRYDAGHPLQIDEQIITEFLRNNFHPVYQRRDEEKENYLGFDLTEEVIHFIGGKKSETCC